MADTITTPRGNKVVVKASADEGLKVFRITGGDHFVNEVVYTKDDEIISGEDFVRSFVGKFEYLGHLVVESKPSKKSDS